MAAGVGLVARHEDHIKNEIRNFKWEQLAADPTGGDLYEGRSWYNTTTDQYKGYANGTVVVLQQSGAAGVTSFTATTPLENTGNAADPVVALKTGSGAGANGISDTHIASDAAIANTKLATNPLARVNHTGTQLAATLSDLATAILARSQHTGTQAAATISDLATAILARAQHTGTQLASTISDFDTQVRTNRLDQMAQPTAAVPFNAQKITGLANGTADTDAANFGQVNALVAGVSFAIARAASTANVVIATALENGDALDGVTLATGDIVLLKNQTAPEENGPYTVVASGAAARTPGYDTSAEVKPGLTVTVNEGTAGADTEWRLFTNAPITLNTTGLTFSQIPTTDVTAGAGLTRTGNTVDVVAGTGITVNANDVALTVPVTIANGGTGQITAAAALAALGGTTKFSATFGDGAASDFTLTHNMNTRALTVEVFRTATPWDTILCDVERPTVNTVKIYTVGYVPTSGEFTAVIVG